MRTRNLLLILVGCLLLALAVAWQLASPAASPGPAADQERPADAKTGAPLAQPLNESAADLGEDVPGRDTPENAGPDEGRVPPTDSAGQFDDPAEDTSTETTAGDLHVRVVLMDDEVAKDFEVTAEITPTGPFGNEDLVPSRDSHSIEHQLSPTAGGWEGTVTGLPPGIWSVSVDTHLVYGEAARAVELTAGQSGSVTLYIGEGAMATWLPTVRVAGRILTSFRAWHTDPWDGGLAGTFLDYSADMEGAPIELPAGEYTFWLPMLRPVTVALDPGEQRRDTFDIPARWVEFSITPELAGLMAADEEVQLKLTPRGYPDMDDPVMYEIEHLFGEDARNSRWLSPARAIRLPVPVGEYDWGLWANRGVAGRLSVTEATSSVHFDLYDLPGLATLDIHLRGFDAGSASVDCGEDYYLQTRVEGFQTLASIEFGPSIAFDPVPPCEDIVHVWELDDSLRAIAFSVPGPKQLEISGEVDGTYLSRKTAVVFPGRIDVYADDLMTDHVEIKPEYDDTMYAYRVTAIHETGLVAREDSSELRFPPGWVRLEVVRSNWKDRDETNEQEGRHSIAVIELQLAGADVTVKLDELDYTPHGVVDVIFRGPGSPERVLDAWWFQADGIPAPRAYFLDHEIHGRPRLALIGTPKYEPRHGLQAAIRDRALPPGRYRLVPWENAPEKYHRAFTVRPGERTSVTIDTRE